MKSGRNDNDNTSSSYGSRYDDPASQSWSYDARPQPPLAAPIQQRPGLPARLELAPFPQKLHYLLADVDRTSLSHVVSWLPDGLSFQVHQKDAFCKVVRLYFKLTKMKSFTRQLNLYGFLRVQQGHRKGSYGHPLFQRHRPDLLTKIYRKRRGSSHVRAGSTLGGATVDERDHTEDNNSQLVADTTTMAAATVVTASTGRSSPQDSLSQHDIIDVDAAHTCPTMSFDEDSVFGGNDDTVHENIEDDPLFQSFVDGSRGVEPAKVFDEIPFGMLEFHTQAEERTSQALDRVLNLNSAASRGSLSRHYSFPFKLHDMLCVAEHNNFANVVSWVRPNAFKVHSVEDFVEHIMPFYFDQTKYPSFRRQLNSYGFQRCEDGSYFHELFQKANKSLCKDILRRIYLK